MEPPPKLDAEIDISQETSKYFNEEIKRFRYLGNLFYNLLYRVRKKFLNIVLL